MSTIKKWNTQIDLVRNNVCVLFNQVSTSHISKKTKMLAFRITSFDRVTCADLNDDSAFRYNDNKDHLELSLVGLNLILDSVKSKSKARISEKDAMYMAVFLYLSHEVTHILQNIKTFDDVQVIKATAGSNQIGRFDLEADIEAAKLYSAVHNIIDLGDQIDAARLLLRALWFMIEYCFPAFGLPSDKKHKVQRAIGIGLVFDVTKRFIDDNNRNNLFDYSSALYPELSDDMTQCVIFDLSGDYHTNLMLVKVTLDPTVVKQLSEILESGNYDKILSYVTQIFA